jgi:carbamate kinase
MTQECCRARAVVDKDLTTALVACSADAGGLLLIDVDAVQDGYGTPHAYPIDHTTPGRTALARLSPTAPEARRSICPESVVHGRSGPG